MSEMADELHLLESKGAVARATMNQCLSDRQYIHALWTESPEHIQSKAHRIEWIHQLRGQPMHQLRCMGITPNFPKLRRRSIFRNVLLVPHVCIIADYA